ncbi:MAG: hypothetical protein WCR19_05635, partial [Acholeplasmataceae bacterium]
MKNLKAKIAHILNLIKSKIKALWDKISDFYREKIDPIFTKINDKLHHNFFINFKGQDLFILRKIKIHISRKRRESFYGFMFILIWIIGFLV